MTENKTLEIKQDRVIITDIDIKFGSMISLMVKAAFAAIPAMIIVMIIVWGFMAIFGGIFGVFR